MWAGEVFESRYRVNEFRRFIPKAGEARLGLVQFWGPRARRRYAAGSKPPPFEVDCPEDTLQTVDVSAVQDVTDARR
jgi:hypothetical protein